MQEMPPAKTVPILISKTTLSQAAALAPMPLLQSSTPHSHSNIKPTLTGTAAKAIMEGEIQAEMETSLSTKVRSQ